jgi:hypothetical protein
MATRGRPLAPDLQTLVRGLRELGYTFRQIGRALGISKNSALKYAQHFCEFGTSERAGVGNIESMNNPTAAREVE